MSRKNKIPALYVHVPFCNNLCHYCDFCKFLYNKDFVDKYLDTLEKELDSKQALYDSIYIGGGSPSSLDYKQLDRLLRMVSKLLSNGASFTVEVNPDDMDEKKVSLLEFYKVNRVSIGVETFDDELLRMIGRKHSYEQVKELVGLLRLNGIMDITCDLMFGLPNQTINQIENDLDILVNDFKIKHISTYALLIEPNTYFSIHSINALDDDTQADQYAFISQYLKKCGFERYEVSNFAIPGNESKHNLIYWEGKEYVGVGPGASGYEDGVRYTNSRSLSAYCKGNIKREYQELNASDKEYEFIILSLRLSRGLIFSEYKRRFNKDFLKEYEDVIDKLKKEELIAISDKALIVKEEKMFILNQILKEF